MTNEDQEQERFRASEFRGSEFRGSENQGSENDDLDRALDMALAQYAAVEPRLGLEDRILANLRTEQALARPLPWWRWSWATAAAIVIIAALLAWKSAKTSHPVVRNHPAAVQTQALTMQAPVKPALQVASSATSPKRAPASRLGVRPSIRPHLATATANPKLDVFPSPQPLSEEELALAQYVRNFPTDAKLVAQAQEASEREVLAKMQALANESGESN
jgi:hypothetical protein